MYDGGGPSGGGGGCVARSGNGWLRWGSASCRGGGPRRGDGASATWLAASLGGLDFRGGGTSATGGEAVRDLEAAAGASRGK